MDLITDFKQKNMYTLEQLQPLIIEWAKDKNLIFPENAPKQLLKLIEECGELASAILKEDIELQKDAIGDIFVVLVIYHTQTKTPIKFCFSNTDIIDIKCCVAIERIIANDNFAWFSYDYLNDISKYLGHDLTECANLAWNEIKNRTGKTVNGTFIKD